MSSREGTPGAGGAVWGPWGAELLLWGWKEPCRSPQSWVRLGWALPELCPELPSPIPAGIPAPLPLCCWSPPCTGLFWGWERPRMSGWRFPELWGSCFSRASCQKSLVALGNVARPALCLFHPGNASLGMQWMNLPGLGSPCQGKVFFGHLLLFNEWKRGGIWPGGITGTHRMLNYPGKLQGNEYFIKQAVNYSSSIYQGQPR